MAKKLFLLPLFTTLAAAKNTVTSMVIPDFDAPTMVASIMGNDATATTYSLTCSPLPEGDDCGMGPGLTMVAQATTTSVFLDEDEEDFHFTILCSVGGTTSAVCTETAKGNGANNPGEKHVSTYSGSNLPLVPVTITAGSVTSAAEGSDATSTASTATATSAESTSTESSASGGSTSTSASTGGMPQMTGDVKALFGGAAVAIAAAFI
ncbi:hypothetical protein ASPWEDRAFT_167562 [Aspergillus wentii DTO 134E9]|uniref:GPI anchored protein n=1 Tax=Aspergillus wentii DTO 134E9 TaxID=1073089 RepID=A0A1L9S318_ASPWE|nr:uncharacterized protein ASPWEDRAFT_167562 [Aspergillus wentii DTO 134E9]KAI9929896.1 hypothetical protein MW887_011706 [Aspergillus wentii]OJJ41548.1 hypothetical protein ASPWEDRAFT_167562 [Aspergillus wentii DTO 134E9]